LFAAINQDPISPDRPVPTVWLGLVLVVLTLGTVAPTLNPYYLRVLTMGLMFGYLAASWNIIGGYAGQMSLGHAIFFGVGSYTVALLSHQSSLPLLLAFPIALVVAGVLALCVAIVCFRYALKGIYFAIGTMLLAEIARILATNSDWMGRSHGLQVPPGNGVINLSFASSLPFFYIFLVMSAGLIVYTTFMSRSRFGYAMVALREQEDAAKALAIDVTRVKRKAFVLSGLLTAAGGVVYAGMVRFVDPGYDLSLSVTLMMVMGAVLGGRGTVWGPFVGGGIVVLVQELLVIFGSWVGTTSVSALAQMIYGLFFVVILLAFPRGIVGEIIARRADRKASTGTQSKGDAA
jgi:branched-chain amino acid transport system permease protein